MGVLLFVPGALSLTGPSQLGPCTPECSQVTWSLAHCVLTLFLAPAAHSEVHLPGLFACRRLDYIFQVCQGKLKEICGGISVGLSGRIHKIYKENYTMVFQ